MESYVQTTEFTTAAAALLTILHNHDGSISLTQENEFKIWHKSVNLPTRGSSIYALGTYAKRKGLNPKIIVENKTFSFPDYRFYRYTKQDIEYATFSEKSHYKKAKSDGIEIEQREITFSEIKEVVKSGKILLLRINTKPIRKEKRNTSNYIVVHGFDGEYFQIFDPKIGGSSVPIEVMEQAYDTLETKKHRDHRMIIFS